MTKPKNPTAAKTPPTTPRTPAPRRRPDVPMPKPEDVKLEPSVLDLSARAAARRAQAKAAPKVKVGAVTYELPVELRLETLRGVFGLINGDLLGLERMLNDFFGEEATTPPPELTPAERAELTPAEKTARAKREKAYNPAFDDLTIDDLGDLFDYVTSQYGIDLGNSPASTAS